MEQPGQPCDPTPVTGIAELSVGSKSVARTTIAVDGSYRLEVPTGKYTLAIIVDGIFPSCQPIDVVVADDDEVRADVLCDTGIR